MASHLVGIAFSVHSWRWRAHAGRFVFEARRVLCGKEPGAYHFHKWNPLFKRHSMYAEMGVRRGEANQADPRVSCLCVSQAMDDEPWLIVRNDAHTARRLPVGRF